MAQGKTFKDIVTTAVETGSFKTLVTALEAAGLVETFQAFGWGRCSGWCYTAYTT